MAFPLAAAAAPIAESVIGGAAAAEGTAAVAGEAAGGGGLMSTMGRFLPSILGKNNKSKPQQQEESLIPELDEVSRISCFMGGCGK